jgi:hypothetical protein
MKEPVTSEGYRARCGQDVRVHRAKLAAVVRLFAEIDAAVNELVKAERLKTATMPPKASP